MSANLRSPTAPKSGTLRLFVFTVSLAAVAAVTMLPGRLWDDRPGTVWLLVGLAALAGARPVRFPALKTEIVATHPFVLCALGALGPRTAVLVAVAGIAGAMAIRKRRVLLHVAFNLGAVILITTAAHWAFTALGGTPGSHLLTLFLPLVGATATYFVANTGLVAAVIALDKGQSLLVTWKDSLQWTAVSCFTGLPLAASLLLVLETIGPWGLALGMPPTLLLMAFYRTHKERIEEKLLRIEEVETLNAQLEQTVQQLSQALDHVRQGSRRLQQEINERQQAEDALRRSEEQLLQSQKMEAIGRLAGGIAHDFNNLLTAITGYSELVLGKLGQDDTLRDNVQEIWKASDRAASLTRQLLAFSRRQVLAPKVLDLNATVENMDKLLRRLIGEDVELEPRLCPNPGYVRADPGQMEQVIMNLAVNSRDAMAAGGKLVIETAGVELRRGDCLPHPDMPAGPYVRLSVQDTGCGMDEETRSQVFEPFFTTKPEGMGTGLGLSTVFGIVKQSAGWIFLDSDPGRGTTFSIFLPRVEGEPETAEVQPTAAGVNGGTETVLLVEDEDQIRDLTREILEMNGYTVFEAAEPAEALSTSERLQGPIHLLLTDIVMPGMNGPDLYERLAPDHPRMKILYMSGYTDRDLAGHATLQEGAAFIQKPFGLDALAKKVREVLDRRPSA